MIFALKSTLIVIKIIFTDSQDNLLTGYTKTSDHTHSFPLTPNHLYPAKIYLCPAPPTHKKCLPTPTHPKYTSTHPHPSPLTHKKCPSTSTRPKFISNHPYPPVKNVHLPHLAKIYPHAVPPIHIKCPPTPTHPKYTSTYPHPMVTHSTLFTGNLVYACVVVALNFCNNNSLIMRQ